LNADEADIYGLYITGLKSREFSLNLVVSHTLFFGSRSSVKEKEIDNQEKFLPLRALVVFFFKANND
jgi:hypothetical protein